VRPEGDIAACAAAHAALLAALRDLNDVAARAPSLLPGWSVGHVLTHVARNADSVVRRLAGAARGELVTQYAGGDEGRAAAIEAGAHRPAAELVDDVARSASAVDALFREVPDELWDAHVLRGSGPDWLTAERLVWSRLREVEIHHVDLGLGYRPADWPGDLVGRMLAELLPGLPQRTDPAELMAWLIGRAGPPALDPWS
jgi:maleylpyruvate isomerase